MGLRRRGFGQESRDHVGMAPRLEDERAAKMIRMAPQPITFLEYRPARRAGDAVDDETQRVAARVRIDRPDRVSHVLEYASTSRTFPLERVHSRPA